jgi:FkbM family methyltransferase
MKLRFDSLFRFCPALLPLRYIRRRLFPRKTYAADYEDMAAWIMLGGVKSFVDVGANDGISGSNTFLFALRGAAGLCFEPDPVNFVQLAGMYRCHRRILCVAEGMSDITGQVMMRCDGLFSTIAVTEDTGLKSLLAGWRSAEASEVKIVVNTMAHWFSCQPAFVGCDVLSIDVEGHELNVLRGIDWTATPKPARCLIVETHAKGAAGSWSHRDLGAISELLAVHGYQKVARSANNTFWLHTDDIVASRFATVKMMFPRYQWNEGEKIQPWAN